MSVYRLSYSRGEPRVNVLCIDGPEHPEVVFVPQRAGSGNDYRPLLRRLALSYGAQGPATESETSCD